MKKKTAILLVICSIVVLAMILLFVLGSLGGNKATKTDLNVAKEQARIAENIQNNKLDHVLEDIDKLYPPNQLSESEESGRFILLWNYYKKTGDTQKKKQLVEDASKKPSIKNAYKDIFDEENQK